MAINRDYEVRWRSETGECFLCGDDMPVQVCTCEWNRVERRPRRRQRRPFPPLRRRRKWAHAHFDTAMDVHAACYPSEGQIVRQAARNLPIYAAGHQPASAIARDRDGGGKP